MFANCFGVRLLPPVGMILAALTLLYEVRGYPETVSAVHRAVMIERMLRLHRQLSPEAEFCSPQTDSHFLPLPCCQHCSAQCGECEDCGECEEASSHACCPDNYADLVEQQKDVMRTCTPTSLKSQNGSYMFSHCPEDTDQTLANNCTTTEVKRNLAEIVPVTHHSSGTVYKNVYCALCNRVAQAEVEPWLSRVQCKGDAFTFTSIDAAMEDLMEETPGYCDLLFEPGSERPPDRPPIMPCVVNSGRKRCNITSLWKDYDEFVDYACHFFYSPLRMIQDGKNFWYPNIFCAFCNGHEDLSDVEELQYGVPRMIGEMKDTQGVRYSILLDAATLTTDFNAPQQCERGHVYDTAQDECLPTHCSVLRRLEGGECQLWMGDISVFTYLALFRFVPHFQLTLDKAYSMVPDIVVDIGVSLFRDDLDRQCMFKTVLSTSGDEATEKSTIAFIDLNMDCVVMEAHDPELIYKTVSEKKFSRRNLLQNGEYPFSVYTCGSSDGYVFPSLTLINKIFYRSLVHEDRLLNNTNNQGRLDLSLTLSTHDPLLNVTSVPYLVDNRKYEREYDGFHGTELLSLAPCPVTRVTRGDYPWRDQLTGLTFETTGARLATWQYVYEGHNRSAILVCLDTYRRIITSTGSRGQPKMAMAVLLIIIVVKASAY